MKMLVIDTETGGLDPRYHSLLEVGMVAIDENFNVLVEDSFYIRNRYYNVTPTAMAVNGLDVEMVHKKGITHFDAIDRIKTLIEIIGEKPVVVGHNVRFDYDFIQYQLFEKGYDDFKEYVSHRMIDTMSILHGMYLAGRVPKEALSSEGAFRYYGIDVENRHTALGDCRATIELLKILVNRLVDF